MENLYSDLLKRQEAERERLQGQRFNDIERMQQMGRHITEIKQVHDYYQVQHNALAAKQEQEKADYLKQKELRQPDKSADFEKLVKEARENRLRGEQDKKIDAQKLREELREAVVRQPNQAEQERKAAELRQKLEEQKRDRERNRGRSGFDYDR